MLLSIRNSKNNNKNNFTLGIDLGTSYSTIAMAENNQYKIITDAVSHKKLLPSTVYYAPDGTVQVGDINSDINKNNNIIRSAKRLLGCTYQDIINNYQKYRALFSDLKFAEQNGELAIETAQGCKTVPEILSEILKKLVGRINDINLNKQSKKLLGVVVTVPAYFNERQRQALKQAIYLANLPCLRLLNEPTAAAIAYGLENNINNINNKNYIAVYDLGGGTFDLSILKLSPGFFEVVATSGDIDLGGDDVDLLIANYLINKYFKKIKNLKINSELLRQARYYKEQLTNKTKIKIKNNINNKNYFFTRAEFNKLINNFIDQTINITQQTLDLAKIDKTALSEIILIGGMTRIPYLRQKLTTWFGREPLDRIDPEETVALGAAYLANRLINNHNINNINQWLLIDVTPLNLGIEVLGNTIEWIIPRQSKLPIIEKKLFTTAQDQQIELEINIFQGISNQVISSQSLGTLLLNNIPALPAGQPQIEVIFELSSEGLLTVSARELSQNQSVKTMLNIEKQLENTQRDILAIDDQTIALQDQVTQRLHIIQDFIEKYRSLISPSIIDEFNQLYNNKNIDINVNNILNRIQTLEESLKPIILQQLEKRLKID